MPWRACASCCQVCGSTPRPSTSPSSCGGPPRAVAQTTKKPAVAESRADFVHKVRVATKELREAYYWLRVVQRSNWLSPGAADRLVDEVDQLVAILVASARTAKSSISS